MNIDDLLTLANQPSLCAGLRMPFVMFFTNGYLSNLTNEAANEIDKCVLRIVVETAPLLQIRKRFASGNVV